MPGGVQLRRLPEILVALALAIDNWMMQEIEAETLPPPRPQVTLLRFSLRKMLLYVSALCVLFAAMSAVGGMVAMAVLLVALVVAAHVLSTFVGTKLRDGSTATSAWEALHGKRTGESLLAVEHALPPRSHWRLPTACQLQRRGPVVRRMAWLVAAGIVVGAGAGVGLMLQFLWPRIGLAAILAGGTAAAILGGWTAFLGSSFLGITRRAWQEAVEGEQSAADVARETVPANTAPDRW
jgi:hypothetical protein